MGSYFVSSIWTSQLFRKCLGCVVEKSALLNGDVKMPSGVSTIDLASLFTTFGEPKCLSPSVIKCDMLTFGRSSSGLMENEVSTTLRTIFLALEPHGQRWLGL
eukprot:3539876-Ditylum_brightwellii.AAC.1